MGKCAAYSVVGAEIAKIPEGVYRGLDIRWRGAGRFKHLGIGWAVAGLKMSVKPRVAIASNDKCLTRGPNVRFDVSNDGLIPRRLVLELFIVCIGFSFLRFGFLVLVFPACLFLCRFMCESGETA